MKKAKSLLGRMCAALKFGPTLGVVLRQMLKGMVMQLVLATAGLGAAQAQTVTYFHNDAAGTPLLATNAAGAVVWKDHYLPYGHRQVGDAASTDNKLGYAGKAYEPQTQLSYMGARYYMPVLGRFTGIDPVEMVPEQPHSLNRYAYANNNPYKYVDPDGKAAETVWDAFNIALGFQSLVSNLRAGNWSGAALDGVGVALDGVAAAIPVVPGGAAAAIKAYRAADAAKGLPRLAAPVMHDHHLMPRQFKDFFSKRGIDIDAHTVSLGEKSHLTGVHGKGLGNMPGGWNQEWAGWISKNPNATAKDVYQQLGTMMDRYKINDLPIHPFGK